jgi:aryl-alcohol dehydrogenase-like predicted oxidoreductase
LASCFAIASILKSKSHVEATMIGQAVFGRTGHKSTRTLFGAAALSSVTQAEADATIELLQSYGVNHYDTAASYGESELRIGSWISRHGRPYSFLATKTGERTYAGARDEFHRSLERLNVDRVDMIQLHNLVEPQEWETALGPGGALEALIEAREQGLVRFIGVTGHGLTVAAMHLKALQRFDFDSVLLPLNYVLEQKAQYMEDFKALTAYCVAHQVAIQTIKSITRAPWGDRQQTHATWYEPLEEQSDIDLAVQWVLGYSGLFLNTVGDIHVLPKVLSAADRFDAGPADEDMKAMLSRLEMSSLFV